MRQLRTEFYFFGTMYDYRMVKEVHMAVYRKKKVKGLRVVFLREETTKRRVSVTKRG